MESIECDLFEQLPNEEIKVVEKQNSTIQDLIDFCEEIAQEHEERAEKYDRWDEEESVYADYCTSYAAKHRKIAEILNDIICVKPILFSSVQQCTLCGNTCPLSPQEQFDVRNELCGVRADADNCRECAADHRQLTEWLKELRAYRKLKICGNCRHYVGGTTHFGECHVTSDIEPCVVSVCQTACDTFFDYKDFRNGVEKPQP